MGKKVVLLFLLLLIPLVSAFDFPSDDLTVNTYTGTLTNLSEMEDTNIPAPSNNEVLSWSEATGMWIAKAVAGITDYFTQAEILGFGYYNLTDFDIADYYTSSEVDDINTSMENYIGVVNTSMKNYVDSIGTGDANWDAVFNATLLIVDTEINTSMKNYVDYVNSTNPTDTNTNAETICSGALYLAGNGTCTTDLDTDTTYSDLSEFNDDIGVSADWDEIGDIPTATPSDSDTTHLSTADQIYDWVVGLAYATTTYVNVQNSSVVNWVNDIFYTKTEVNAINTSMRNYVDDTFLTDVVSDTTPQLGGDLYANNHDIALNDSDKLYFGNSKDISCNFDGTDFIWTQEVGSPQFKFGGNLNMSVNNVTAINCIIFDSGGKICSS